jgi:Kef-type K+ transport system membrane component KefB
VDQVPFRRRSDSSDFLAGAELDPNVFRKEWKQAGVLCIASFAAPFLGCAALARWVLGGSTEASSLAGIAMSTTSVAVVYAVMLEFGLNATHYGKVVLAACFVTDLATVVLLGLIVAPSSWKTLVFLLEAKFLMFTLFGLGALATWADSEAVLPAYLLGMVLAPGFGGAKLALRETPPTSPAGGGGNSIG